MTNAVFMGIPTVLCYITRYSAYLLWGEGRGTYIYFWCCLTGGLSGDEESCPSVESLINWLLEHDDAGVDELSDDSDILLSYIDDTWSDHEAVLVEDLPDEEVSVSSSFYLDKPC